MTQSSAFLYSTIRFSPRSNPVKQSLSAQVVSSLAVSPNEPAPHISSSERTLLCQDKRYPFVQSKLLRGSHTISTASGADVHWRGNAYALFKMSCAAKLDIQAFILGICGARDKGISELTKTSGTRFIYVLDLSSEDGEQEALCIPTNPTTLQGIYSFRDDETECHYIEQRQQHFQRDSNMNDGRLQRFPRTQVNASFVRLMAIANEEGFPLTDRELDSDPDSSDEYEEIGLPSHITSLTAIPEGEEDNETRDGTLDHIPSRYCRDPRAPVHPDCHSRAKNRSYARTTADAGLELQERFFLTHNSGDNTAHYRNWNMMKWKFGESMVHGGSPLRDEVPIWNAGERLLGLIDEKYGPLTKAGQSHAPVRGQARCLEVCEFKIERFVYDDLNEDDESVAEPSTLFHGVADMEDDSSPAPAVADSPGNAAPPLSEDVLLKILNTSHDEFVDHYVRRQQALRGQARRAKQLCLAEEAKITDVVVSDARLQRKPTETATAATAKVEVLPEDVLTSHSSRDSISGSTSVFSRNTSVTTKASDESFASDDSHLLDTLNLEVVHQKDATDVSRNHWRVTSMPILSVPVSNMCGKTSGVSARDQISLKQRSKTVPSTPLHTTPTDKKCLTPIFELQTPQHPPSEQTADMFTTPADRAQSFVEPRESTEIASDEWAELFQQSKKPQTATTATQSQSSWSDDSSPTHADQGWGTKVKCSMETRFRCLSVAIKYRARRAVQSAKKLGATVRYMVRVVKGPRNPHKTATST